MNAEKVSPAQYMDQIAMTALAIVEDIRQVNPYELLDQLTRGCQDEPVRMAQVIMALAAMMPTHEPISRITQRVWAISTPITKGMPA